MKNQESNLRKVIVMIRSEIKPHVQRSLFIVIQLSTVLRTYIHTFSSQANKKYYVVNGLFFLNSKLHVWPPDQPDLVNYNYVITFLFKYPTTHTP